MTSPPNPSPDGQPLDMSPQDREWLANELEKLAAALRDDRAVVYVKKWSFAVAPLSSDPNRLTVSAAWYPRVDVPNDMSGPRPDPRTGYPVWGSESEPEAPSAE